MDLVSLGKTIRHHCNCICTATPHQSEIALKYPHQTHENPYMLEGIPERSWRCVVAVDSRELRSLAARLEGISMRRNLRQALHVAGSIMERMAEGVLLSREDFGKHVQSMLSGLPEEDVALFVSKVRSQSARRCNRDVGRCSLWQ